MAQGVGLAFSEVESAQDYIRSRGLIHLYLFCRRTSASDKLRPTHRRRDASSLRSLVCQDTAEFRGAEAFSPWEIALAFIA